MCFSTSVDWRLRGKTKELKLDPRKHNWVSISAPTYALRRSEIPREEEAHIGLNLNATRKIILKGQEHHKLATRKDNPGQNRWNELSKWHIARLVAHNTLVKQNTEQYKKMALNITKIYQRWPTALTWKIIKDLAEQCVLWSQHLAFECWLAGPDPGLHVLPTGGRQVHLSSDLVAVMSVCLVIIRVTAFSPAVACFGAAISFLVVFSWWALILKLLVESLRMVDIGCVVYVALVCSWRLGHYQVVTSESYWVVHQKEEAFHHIKQLNTVFLFECY